MSISSVKPEQKKVSLNSWILLLLILTPFCNLYFQQERILVSHMRCSCPYFRKKGFVLCNVANIVLFWWLSKGFWRLASESSLWIPSAELFKRKGIWKSNLELSGFWPVVMNSMRKLSSITTETTTKRSVLVYLSVSLKYLFCSLRPSCALQFVANYIFYYWKIPCWYRFMEWSFRSSRPTRFLEMPGFYKLFKR